MVKTKKINWAILIHKSKIKLYNTYTFMTF